jgi:2-(1,2-epoxy-1,2-dihydrophenyl)acetyl-CoA isomerase
VVEKKEAQLLKDQRDGVLTLTINRPERRNALSPEIYEDMRETLSTAADDSAIGAVVITGAGGAFSAGGDVARMAAGAQEQPSYEERVARLRRRAEIGELLHTMEKPTIAMIRGAAVGAGLSMALACDMRFGDTTAKMRTGFLNVGLAGDHGGHYFLPRLVGMAKARELYLTSPMLDAQAALALGLLNSVLEPDALEEHVMKLAAGLASGPRTAIAYMKRNLNDGLHLPLGQMLDQESWRHVRCTDTADHREATRAYMEKRPPKFTR